MVAAAGSILAVGGVLVAAAFQPKEFHIERSVETDASVQDIYAILSDLNQYPKWSPWQDRDPGLQQVIEVHPGVVGSRLTWKGNKDVGSGRMIVTEAQSNQEIALKLEFSRPFTTTNKVRWTIERLEDKRKITWAMDGVNDSLMPRVFGMFMDMDSIIGRDFEKGLGSLKTLAEESLATV